MRPYYSYISGSSFSSGGKHSRERVLRGEGSRGEGSGGLINGRKAS